MDPHSLTWGPGLAEAPAGSKQGTGDDKVHPRRGDRGGYRSSPQTHFLASQEVAFVIFLLIQLLNCFDTFSTLRLVARCGWACEANPIMRALGESVSVQVWIAVKLGVVFLLTSLVLKKKGEWLLWVLLPLTLVALLHLVVS